ncbi:TLDc domain-containing protein [Entamoeba marina]
MEPTQTETPIDITNTAILTELLLSSYNIHNKQQALFVYCCPDTSMTLKMFLRQHFELKEDEIEQTLHLDPSNIEDFLSCDLQTFYSFIHYIQQLGFTDILQMRRATFEKLSPAQLQFLRSTFAYDAVTRELAQIRKDFSISRQTEDYIPPSLRNRESNLYTPPKSPHLEHLNKEIISNPPQPQKPVKKREKSYRLGKDCNNVEFGKLLSAVQKNEPCVFYHSITPKEMMKPVSDGNCYIFAIQNDTAVPFKYSAKPFNKTLTMKDDRLVLYSVGTFISNHSVRYNGDIHTVFNVPKSVSIDAFIPFNGIKEESIPDAWVSIALIKLN